MWWIVCGMLALKPLNPNPKAGYGPKKPRTYPTCLYPTHLFFSVVGFGSEAI